MNNTFSQYKNNSVFTASPGELTLMLYNGAIKFCNMAIDGIEKKDIQKAHTSIIKAQDIINELQVTLDRKYEISASMDRMYAFIMDTLRDANIEKNTEKVSIAKRFIQEFRDTWQEVMKVTASAK